MTFVANHEALRRFATLVCLALVVGFTPSAAAQTGGTCIPVSQRAGRELGCFITAREELGTIPKDSSLFWHLDAYPTRAAAEAAKGPRSTVVESLGRIWLFTIADAGWRPTGGERVTAIGPLPWAPAPSYAAVYMEGVFRPGMASVVHRHPGVEAWYTLEGEQCLETPAGTLVQRAGGAGVMVPAGVPMILTGSGTIVRRSLVLILQDASKPRSTPAPDWTPKGLCATAGPDASLKRTATEDSVAALVAAYDRAWKGRDSAAVGRILATDYQYFTSTGRVESRGEALAMLVSPGYVLERADRSEVAVRVTDPVAIVSSRWRGQGTFRGERFTDDQRCGQAWLRTGHAWQVLSEHCVQIVQASAN